MGSNAALGRARGERSRWVMAVLNPRLERSSFGATYWIDLRGTCGGDGRHGRAAPIGYSIVFAGAGGAVVRLPEPNGDYFRVSRPRAFLQGHNPRQ